jgi:indolepyruvate ferredoxin oxidoreductase, subunit iorA (EC 1.2.7.8)
MQSEPLLDAQGQDEFLLGNEAVARGLYEAGVSVAATYPGTPSSEIGDVLYKLSERMGIKFEFATNEKVALEIAAAASSGGLRSFVFMKHVGLNVAMDSFVSLSGSGVKGGLVVFSADDPSMHSSQNEQDNRFLGKFAKTHCS